MKTSFENKKFRLVFVIGLLIFSLSGCSSSGNGNQVQEYPIDTHVYTTAQQQILPIALPASTPHINPRDVSLYEVFGYSSWQKGRGLEHVRRTDLAPGNTAANAARLLSFFAMTDIHIADKESPAQPIYMGWSALYGPSSANYSSAYTPVLLSTTQVLDAAIQTVNALDKKSPFDFGIFLGDAINNSQYNELRWYIDVIDGKVITPSSGAHAGAGAIDYQKPFKAFGLNKAIPWYQVIGNHDQFFIGWAYQDAKLLQAHVADTILNMENNFNDWHAVNGTGFYMGVVDGSTPYGDIIGAGPEANFPIPPTVIADPDRRSLATTTSSSLNWMSEFFKTTSKPAGHGFTQTNLNNDFACYSFQPKPDIPVKVIVLDDTCKGDGQQNYALGCLDQSRLDWLTSELQEGQDNNELMIIAAHIPINPYNSLTDPAKGNFSFFRVPGFRDSDLLAIIHNYPNLILWISGHRHINVVTPQPFNAADLTDSPENSFWEVETASFHDFPQQFRTFDIRRNSDNNISIIITNVDPAVTGNSPAAKSRGYAVGASRIFGADDNAIPPTREITSSQAYNAELVKQLTPAMQAIIAPLGSTIK
jgi:metallophosphoesterase (TIGR03768 family)